MPLFNNDCEMSGPRRKKKTITIFRYEKSSLVVVPYKCAWIETDSPIYKIIAGLDITVIRDTEQDDIIIE